MFVIIFDLNLLENHVFKQQ